MPLLGGPDQGGPSQARLGMIQVGTLGGQEGHRLGVVQRNARRQRAVRVAVATGQNIGTQIEITPDQPEALPDGARIVMDGAAYLRDGDPINAFIEVEVKL